jgi:site-specific DNA-methyltransferase (adenine-specific)
MARKPLVGTVAANVLRYGTGALNIDATRIPFVGERPRLHRNAGTSSWSGKPTDAPVRRAASPIGTPSTARAAAGPPTSSSPTRSSMAAWRASSGEASRRRGGRFDRVRSTARRRCSATRCATRRPSYGDSGTYSRFFLIPKADRADREPVLGGPTASRRAWQPKDGGGIGGADLRGETSGRQRHPTVKPTDLMRHLVRLVTPPGGTVLDPFLGSGTTALAAELEGFPWLGIEREAEYVAIAEARLNGTQRGLGLSA